MTGRCRGHWGLGSSVWWTLHSHIPMIDERRPSGSGLG
jgi:hypothetical protein